MSRTDFSIGCGGFKQSGVGGLEAFPEVKTVVLDRRPNACRRMNKHLEEQPMSKTEFNNAAPHDWMIHSRIKGLVALVVGAGSGMGEASAKTFAANGGAVAVADLNAGNAERVAGEIARRDGQALALGLDVSKQSDIDAAIARTVERFDGSTSSSTRPRWFVPGCSRTCRSTNGAAASRSTWTVR